MSGAEWRALVQNLPDGGGWIRPGTLYVCASPIGNLGDVTLRLLQLLRRADRILAEDTRRTRRLLAAFGLDGRVISCHEHNEEHRAGEVVAWLRRGEVVALLTDAGTPGLADPGPRLVSAVAAAGLPVSPLPGPSAALAALSVAGVRGQRCLVEGFLPREPVRRRERVATWRGWPGPVVFFEAPHRLADTLRDVADLFPGGYLVVARELTKQHEEIERGPAVEVARRALARPPRGEYTLVLWPSPDGPAAARTPGEAPGADTPSERDPAAVEEPGAGSFPEPSGTGDGAAGTPGQGGPGEAGDRAALLRRPGSPGSAGATRALPGDAEVEGGAMPGQTEEPAAPALLVEEVDLLVRHGFPPSEAIRRVARAHRVRRGDLYRLYHSARQAGRERSD